MGTTDQMEATENTLGLQHDTINIILEFAPPDSDANKENGVKINGSKDGSAVNVEQISPQLFKSAFLSETSATTSINSIESSAVKIQEIPRSGVIKRRKTYKPQRRTSKQPESYSKTPFVSNSTISRLKRPSAISLHNLYIKNGKVPCSQSVQSEAKQQEVTNNSPQETNPTKQEGGKQISDATKQALKKFLTAKCTGNGGGKSGEPGKKAGTIGLGMNINLSTEEDGSSSKQDETLANYGIFMESCQSVSSIVSVNKEALPIFPILPVESASKEHGTYVDHGIPKEKNVPCILTGRCSEKQPTELSISKSGSSSQIQFCLDFNETTAAPLGDKISLPSPQQPYGAQLDGEYNQEEEEEARNIDISASEQDSEVPTEIASASSAADVPTKEATLPVTQEVDVLVLDSILEPHVTDQCKERSQDVSQVESGAKKKKTKKSIECVECGKVLKSSKAYQQHLNIHYDIRPHKCDECGKSFRQRGHLEKHKLLHSGEKPFVCQYCGHGFRCKYLRRDHERIHTGEKPCKCSVCGEMFRSLQVVSDHQRSVHKLCPSRSHCIAHAVGKTAFKCNICHKTFSWSSALSAHKKTHSDVWAYKCEKCPKVFKLYSNLWNHKRSHSKAKPFKCDLCGQHLKRRGNLKRHILTQHDPVEAEQCLKTSQHFVASHAQARKA